MLRMVALTDSLFAGILFGATLVTWRLMQHGRPAACANLRFAAMLVAAFAVSLVVPVPGLALAVALLVSSVTSALYLLAMFFPEEAPPWVSALLLFFAVAIGFFAMLAQLPAMTAAGQALASAILFAAALSHLAENPRAGLLAGASAISTFLGAMVLMSDATRGLVLFFAASLLLFARASQQAVAAGPVHGRFAIGGERI